MLENPKISVLIPVYNGGIYLKKLIENLQNQTLKDFEIICIEDSSTDDSMDFLQNKAAEDNRIKVIHRQEKGGTAIKGIVYGLPYCNGQYFFFMSQDDLIENDTLEKLYRKATETNADIVVPDMIWFFDDGTDHGGLYYTNKEISGKEAFLKSIDWQLHGFNLRKMDFAKKIGWDDKYYNSCEYASRIHYFYANKVAFCNTKFYYRQNNINSITKTKVKPFKFEVMLTNLRLIDFMLKNGLKKNQECKNLFFTVEADYKHYSSYSIFKDFSQEEIKEAKHILKNVKQEYLKLAFKYGKIKFIHKGFKLFCRPVGSMKLKDKIKYARFLKLKKHKVYKTNKETKKNEFYRLHEYFLNKKYINNGTEAFFYKFLNSTTNLGCEVGYGTYCGKNIIVGCANSKIGKFCSLADNIVIGAGEHPLNYLSTSPFFYMEDLGWRKGFSEIFSYPVTIGNDVWIGDNVFIKGGVTIGDGSVVAAGAVVTKDVSPYTVVGGVPAKVIKYRFDEEIINDLLELKWWNLDDETIKALPFHDIDKCIAELKQIRNENKYAFTQSE